MVKLVRRSERYRVAPGTVVRLAHWATDDADSYAGDKSTALKALERLRGELDRQQELLFADRRRALLIVLQGMDTSGKDGVIREIFRGANPQGVDVASFKVPTADEAAHDFLWRASARLPARGYIGIFNRSHYEDVVVTRVHHEIDRATWRRRYPEIVHFEETLAHEGTVVRKFFLHLAKGEQLERLQARLADPTKHWKFNERDLAERQYWRAYQTAYEQAITNTSTEAAPWYIIPADRRWYRDLVIAQILVATLAELHLRHPPLARGLRKLKLT
jgi:PPK2 family polyphosphate:nucleotide phosphotransferase